MTGSVRGARALAGIGTTAIALGDAPVLWRLGNADTLRVPFALPLIPVPHVAAAVLTVAWVGLAVCFSAGWHTRTVGPALAAVMTFVLLLDAQTYSNHVYLAVLLTGLLTWAEADGQGRAGPDAERAHRSVPVVLLRAQASVVYVFAALSKVNGVFLSGAVMRHVLPGSLRDWLAGAGLEVAVAMALASVTIVLELWLAVALWRRRTRHDAFVVGLALHVGMLVAVSTDLGARLTIAGFALLMFSTYLLFVEPAAAYRTVVWDEGCPSCARRVRWTRRLDWMGACQFRRSSEVAGAAGDWRSEWRRDAAPAEVASGEAPPPVVLHDPRGYAGLTTLLEVLPLTFLVAPLLRAPGVRHLGTRLYERSVKRHQERAVAASLARV